MMIVINCNHKNNLIITTTKKETLTCYSRRLLSNFQSQFKSYTL